VPTDSPPPTLTMSAVSVHTQHCQPSIPPHTTRTTTDDLPSPSCPIPPPPHTHTHSHRDPLTHSCCANPAPMPHIASEPLPRQTPHNKPERPTQTILPPHAMDSLLPCSTLGAKPPPPKPLPPKAFRAAQATYAFMLKLFQTDPPVSLHTPPHTKPQHPGTQVPCPQSPS